MSAEVPKDNLIRLEPKLQEHRVRLVPNLRLENSRYDPVTILLLGDALPEIGAALTPTDARKLAQALLQHAQMVEARAPRVIIPGGGIAPVSPNGA